MRARLVALLLVFLVVPSLASGIPAEDGRGAAALDAAALAIEPTNKVGPVTLYSYYAVLTMEVERLARDHPDLVKVSSAGKSVLGLDLWLLEIADFARIESGEGVPLEDREVVYLDGGTHSNEYSGVYFVTEWLQYLLDEYETDETARWIVENRHTFVVPMVNVDGSHVFGRLNANGVNVNRNFPGTWGAVEENPVVNNPGPTPGSEPETQAVMAVMDRIQPDYVNSIHCCGNLWLHPWGAEQLPAPADLQMFTRICDEVFADVRDDCGPIWSTIYPASGTTADDGYARVGASSWTYEMSGRGRVVGPWAEPFTTQDVRAQEVESWNGVLHAFLNVHLYGAHPVVTAVEGDAALQRVHVTNAGYGNLTHGNVTVAGTLVPLPPLGSGESAVVEVAGAFAPGPVEVSLDWRKREHMARQGASALVATLEAEGDRLVGVLPDGSRSEPLEIASAPQETPGAGLLVLVGAAAAAVGLRRRR